MFHRKSWRKSKCQALRWLERESFTLAFKDLPRMKRWPQPPTATHNHQKTTQVAPMSTNLSDRDCTNTMENSAKEHKKSLAYLWLITIYSLWQSILRSLWKGPFQLLGHQWQQVRQTFYFSSQGLWHSNWRSKRR